MTINDDYWLAMPRGARLVELDRAESLELLQSKKVGRLAFLSAEGPLVLPLNYACVNDHVIIQTVAYGTVARAAIDQKVAFEVDDVDDYLQAGWSVLVTGPAQMLTDDQMEKLRAGTSPKPWAEGLRTLFLGISCEHVSGRRLLPV